MIREINEYNEFEKDMAELKELQNNQFNPGHHIGTGQISRPFSQLSKYPYLIIAMGIVTLVPALFILFSSGSIIFKAIEALFPLIISAALIYGGVARIIEKKKGE